MEGGAKKLSLEKKKFPARLGQDFQILEKGKDCKFVGTRLPENVSKELGQDFQILEEQEKSELEQNFQILEERVSSFVGAKFPDFGKGMYFQCGWGLTLKI